MAVVIIPLCKQLQYLLHKVIIMSANISSYTNKILTYTRGEDVRDAIVDACNTISPSLLPNVDSGDSGKVLMVNSSGKWETTEWT